MSKRLQIILPDDEYLALAESARRQGKPVAGVVRDCLRASLSEGDDIDPEHRLAAILRFTRFAGPTGDIDEILAEIEAGRGLS